MQTMTQKQHQQQKPVSIVWPHQATCEQNHHEHPLHHLQHTIGNQAVQRMMNEQQVQSSRTLNSQMLQRDTAKTVTQSLHPEETGVFSGSFKLPSSEDFLYYSIELNNVPALLLNLQREKLNIACQMGIRAVLQDLLKSKRLPKELPPLHLHLDAGYSKALNEGYVEGLVRKAARKEMILFVAQLHEARPSPVAGVSSPQPMTQPQSVSELWPLLNDAQKRLENHATTIATSEAWKPDVTGALNRLDAAIDFLRPLIADGNIARHTKDGVTNTLIPLYWKSSDFDAVKKHYATLLQVRAHVFQRQDKVAEIEIVSNNLRFFKQNLEVLADEAVSFELDSGVVQAPSFTPKMRAMDPNGATLEKPELRALTWLHNQRDIILEAEQQFHIDRRAIAAVIAWEATHNIMRSGLRAIGPGKMHTYSNMGAGVLPLPKGDALPQQLEQRGFLPVKSDDDRSMLLMGARGSITYIAAAMQAATNIAANYGYDISHNLVALTSFYQGYDLDSWKEHMIKKQQKGEKDFLAADPIAMWAVAHVADLENTLGKPSP